MNLHLYPTQNILYSFFFFCVIQTSLYATLFITWKYITDDKKF